MGTKSRVLVTGAFGNVGVSTVGYLAERGSEVVALDLHSRANAKVEAKLRAQHELTTAWVDISEQAEVERVVSEVRPTHIIHLAALIPPRIYTDEARARRVNIDGTRYLVGAAEALGTEPRFVFASSHTVHGYRNGARELPRLAADTPREACDIYTATKIACEDLLRQSSLPWTILRYGIIFPLRYSKRIDPNDLRLGYLVPLESRSHGLHLQDAGLAAARATCEEAVGKVLMIGGDERWQQRQRFYIENILGAVGVGMLPDEAYHQPDPNTDQSWFYNDWMDTAEGQSLLDYQQHAPDDYFAALARGMRWVRPFTRLLAPLIRRKMVGLSPFYRDEAARTATDSTLTERIQRYVAPPLGG